MADARSGSSAGRWGRHALVALWLLASVAGLAAILVYDSTPGRDAAGRAAPWPAASALPRAAGRPTLVLFLHPLCPCSRATLSELEKLLVPCRDRVDVLAVFVAPAGAPAAFTRTPLRERAASIPGVRTADDPGGIEARRFRAATSGTALLYGARGGLEFQGGLTLARAHEGDNPGRDAVEAILAGRTPETAVTPVFGCPLFDAADAVPRTAGPGVVAGRRP